MIIIVLACLLVALCVYGFVQESEGPALVGGIFGGIAVVAIFAGVGDSMNSASELDAFYQSNNAVYSDAIEIYDGYAVVDEEVLVSVANASYNENMAEFIKEYRNSVLEYNKKLYDKRMWADNWFSGAYLVQPKYAQPIRMRRTTEAVR